MCLHKCMTISNRNPYPLTLESGAFLTSCRWRHEEINYKALGNCSDFILNMLVNLSFFGNLLFFGFSAHSKEPHLLSPSKACDEHKSCPWRGGKWNIKKENADWAKEIKDMRRKKKKRQTQCCDRERRSRNLILVEWKSASSDMVGHSCHTRDITLCEGSVPLSLRRRARKQGFKLHHTAKLSSFPDNLKTNPSSEIYFFLFSHHNKTLLFYLLWDR